MCLACVRVYDSAVTALFDEGKKKQSKLTGIGAKTRIYIENVFQGFFRPFFFYLWPFFFRQNFFFFSFEFRAEYLFIFFFNPRKKIRVVVAHVSIYFFRLFGLIRETGIF